METNSAGSRFAVAVPLSGLACFTNRLVSLVRKRHGLSVIEFHALLALRTHHPSCVQALGSRLESEKSRTSKVLRTLLEKGLVRRSTDLRDRRVEHIALTASGMRMTEQLLEDLEAIGSWLFQNHSENERGAFLRFLNELGSVCIADLHLPSPEVPPKERALHD